MIKQSPNTSKAVAGFVVELMDAANKFHILHLKVTGPGSYAAHKTLNDLYDALPGHADTLAESYQGACGMLLDYPDNVTAPTLKSVKEAISYIDDMHDTTSELQKMIPYSEIVNDLDALKSTLNSAKYKLMFLS
jgi:DNA-binding ferritin-like protein